MDNDATTSGGHQYVTKDFTFMPMNWGVTAANPNYLREAGAVNFEDSNGVICPATMADVLLGANEPDIHGSCMGSTCGRCTGPCKPSEVPGDCPVAHLSVRKDRDNRTPMAVVIVGLTVTLLEAAIGLFLT